MFTDTGRNFFQTSGTRTETSFLSKTESVDSNLSQYHEKVLYDDKK